jgi:hypothetical protein
MVFLVLTDRGPYQSYSFVQLTIGKSLKCLPRFIDFIYPPIFIPRGPYSGADPVWMPPYSWEYGARHRLAPSGGSWLCNESSRSGYVTIVHKYYLFSSPKHCIHKLLDARNKAAKNSVHARLKTCVLQHGHAKKHVQPASNSGHLSEEAGQ